MGEKKQVNTAASVGAMSMPDSGPHLRLVNARVTYRNAPIHLLEKFTFRDLDAAHQAFLKGGFKECVILQTCNRVEVYASGSKVDPRDLVDQWSAVADIPRSDKAAFEVDVGKEAVLHLMKLASGLDSLVVGEDQILGQVRRAFEYSKSKRYASGNLGLAFERAIKVGSRVRTSTGINKGNVSIASIAIGLAEEYFDDLKGKKIILIGTGEAASLVAKVLKKKDVDFFVTSRAPERANSFAETVAGTPIPFESALGTLSDVDIIFTATTAPYKLLTFERIELAMKNRGKGMMIFDLSNPRTVDDRVTSIHGVKLVNMDQIAELVGKNMRSRINEVRSAERLIDDEIRTVDSKIKRMKAEPVVVSIFKDVDSIRERELRKAMSMLGKNLRAEEVKVIDQLSRAIVEGVLAAPMNNLRREIETAETDEMIDMVAKLFRYEEKQARQD